MYEDMCKKRAHIEKRIERDNQKQRQLVERIKLLISKPVGDRDGLEDAQYETPEGHILRHLRPD